jgi:hypothetical protein
MKTKVEIGFLLIVLVGLGCPNSPVTPTPDASDASMMKEASPQAFSDSGGYVDDDGLGDVCDLACTKLWSFGCPESGRNDAGTCPMLCRKDARLLDAACVSRAASKVAVQACHVRCQ